MSKRAEKILKEAASREEAMEKLQKLGFTEIDILQWNEDSRFGDALFRGDYIYFEWKKESQDEA